MKFFDRVSAISLASIIPLLYTHPAFCDEAMWTKIMTEARHNLLTGNLWEADQRAKMSVLDARRSGMSNFRVGQSLDLLAEVYYREGKLPEAKQAAQESLVILRKCFGAGSKELIGPLTVLARTAAAEGDFDASLKLCQDSVALAEKSNPERLSHALTSYMQILAKMGEFDQAEAVKKRLSSLAPKHQNSLINLMNEAAMECSLAAWPMAAKTAQSGVELAQKDHTASGDICLARMLALLGDIYYFDGKYPMAIETAHRAMPLFEKATASQKCELLAILAVLGKASAKAGDLDTALKSFNRLYDLCLTCHDKGDKLIATTLISYREVLLKLGRPEEYQKFSIEIPPEAIKVLCLPTSTSPQHTLVFPDNYSIGDIYGINNAEEKLLGNASGRIHVDAAVPLELHVIKTDLSANTKSLSQIAPEEFWSLSFARSNISDDGMPCFSKLSGVHEIDLHSANVTDKGLAYLCNLKTLYVVNLNRTHITNATLSQFAKNLEPTSQLDVSNTDIDDKAGHELKQLSLLTGLSLAGTKVSDSTVQQLGTLKHIESLNLSRSQITDRSGAYFAQQTNLKKLSLADTNITDSFLKLLAPLRHLENLNLSRTQLTDDGLKYLTNLPSLRILYLDGTKITPGCITALKRMSKLKNLSVYATQAGLPRRIREQIPSCHTVGP